jgi:hypothetical protein
MVIEIRDGDEIVFAMYDDGNVMMKDDNTITTSAMNLCSDASEYLNAWMVKKQCSASTESEMHQCSRET